MNAPRPTHQQWLALTGAEEIVDPHLPVFDPHHHLWDRGGHRFLGAELLEAIDDGHHVIGTGYVECLGHYDSSRPVHLQPVGETAFVVGHLPAPLTGSHGPIHACAAIVGRADLALGDAVDEVLEAHIACGGGRLKGIRYVTAWDESPDVHSAYPTVAGMLRDPAVQQGIRRVGAYGLTFDSWQYFHQLDDVAAAADACPGTRMVVGHLGGPIGIGPYAGRRDEVFAAWRDKLAEVARRPNTVIKLGGLGMAVAGFHFRRLPAPPASTVLAEAWRPYVETAIALFGPERAMFESNYPVDMVSGTHRTLFNAFKHIAAGMSDSEKAHLFWKSAVTTYGVDLGPQNPDQLPD